MPANAPFFNKTEAEIRKLMAGMPRSASDAALRFRDSRDFAHLEGLIAEAIQIYRPKNYTRESAAFPPESRLREDIGLDSLSLAEMAFMFDDLFGIPIETREVAGIVTLGQLSDFLRSKVLGAGLQCPSTPAQ